MRGNRRDPGLIAKSRTEPLATSESVSLSEREKKHAAQEAVVAKSEDTEALSFVARVIGTRDDAREAYIFIVLVLIVVPMVFVVITTKDEGMRSDIVGLFKQALLVGLGFLGGQKVTRRR